MLSKKKKYFYLRNKLPMDLNYASHNIEGAQIVIIDKTGFIPLEKIILLTHHSHCGFKSNLLHSKI